MYDELVKRIKKQAVYLPEKFSKNAELLDVLSKAADAIEELQKAVNFHKPITNADRIRAMNNYELAVFLAKVKALVYRADLPVIAYSTGDMAENLEWLEQPWEE